MVLWWDLGARLLASTLPLVRQGLAGRAVVQEARRVPILQCATHVWDRCPPTSPRKVLLGCPPRARGKSAGAKRGLREKLTKAFSLGGCQDLAEPRRKRVRFEEHLPIVEPRRPAQTRELKDTERGVRADEPCTAHGRPIGARNAFGDMLGGVRSHQWAAPPINDRTVAVRCWQPTHLSVDLVEYRINVFDGSIATISSHLEQGTHVNRGRVRRHCLSRARTTVRDGP